MSLRSLIVLLLLAAPSLGACDRQSPRPEQAPSTAPATPPSDEVTAAPATGAKSAASALHNAQTSLDRSHKGEAARTDGFVDPSGKPVTLASYAGKPVLLNLWATWCAPCVAEMPLLDALAGTLAGKVRVLTISQDLEGAARVAPFFAENKFRHLQPYVDDKAGLSLGYQANLPTTILFDSTGHEVWRVAGAMDWTGAQAAALIAEAR